VRLDHPVTRKRIHRKLHGRAHRAIEDAWAAVTAGRIDLAVRILTRAVRQAGEHPDVWTEYGRILAEAGRLRDAEKALRNAILIAPTFADAHAALAEVLARMGLSIEAYRAILAATALRPGTLLFEELEARLSRALPPDFRGFDA
jgi:cytochrome c-type biogenesis protein CcmH/NrfG